LIIIYLVYTQNFIKAKVSVHTHRYAAHSPARDSFLGGSAVTLSSLRREYP